MARTTENFIRSLTALAVLGLCIWGTQSLAQSGPQNRIPSPDPLVIDPAEDSPAPSEDTVETDNEPLPVIKKKKATDFSDDRRFIEHPNAAKGLIRIDKNKVYYYKVPTSEQKGAGNFKFAMYEPTELANPDDASINYNNIYDEEAFPMILYEHEWQIWQGFGKFGITAGTGLFYATGHGQFETPQPDGSRPREKFMFITVPISVGAIYRMQYWDSQPLVPYGGGGLDLMGFAERRDDDQNPPAGAAFGAAPASHFFAGVAIQLGKGAASFIDLDREYGINKIWITGEFRQYVGLSDKYDFSGEAINGGLTAEF